MKSPKGRARVLFRDARARAGKVTPSPVKQEQIKDYFHITRSDFVCYVASPTLQAIEDAKTYG
jgi:hypothetical protein